MDDFVNRLQTLDPEHRDYLLDTLVARLRDAGQWDRVRQLFATDAWMKARGRWSGQTYEQFLLDISDAWQGWFESTRESDAAPSVPDCLRLALIRTSINSVAENYPPELSVRALEVGLWSPDRALSIAGNIAAPELRIEYYAALLGTGKYSGQQRRSIEKAALELTLAQTNKHNGCEGIQKLARHLDEPLRWRALDRVKTFKDAELRVDGAGSLAKASTGGLREAAWNIAFAAVDRVSRGLPRANALVSLIGACDAHKDEELADAAMKAAGTDAHSIAEIAVAAAKRLRPPRRHELAWLAWETTAARLQDKDLAYLLQKALPLIEPARLESVVNESFDRALTFQIADLDYDFPRPVALIALAPYLSGERLERALNEARGIPTSMHFESMRSMTLNALAKRLAAIGSPERDTLMAESLTSVRDSHYEPHRTIALTDAAEAAAGESARHAAEAVTSALRLPDTGQEGSERRLAIGKLAPILDRPLVERALEGLSDIADNEERAQLFLSVSRRLTGVRRLRLQQAALDALWAIHHHQMAIFTFERLMPMLDPEVALRAFDLSSTMRADGAFSSQRGTVIKAISRRLPAAAVEAALESAIALKGGIDRAATVTSLIHRLDGPVRQRAINVVWDMIEQLNAAPHHHAIAIAELAQFMDSAMAARAWTFLLEKEKDLWHISRAFPALTDRFDSATAVDACAVVVRVRETYHRIASLANLSKKLAEPMRSTTIKEAIHTISSWGDEIDKCARVLAPQVEGSDRERVLTRGFEYARSIPNDEMCAEAVCGLVPYLQGEERHFALREGFLACFRMRKRRRAAMLLDSLVARGDAPFREWAVARVRTIKSPTHRLEGLAGLARRIEEPDALVSEARGLIVSLLTGLRHRRRKIVLLLFSHPAVFAPPVLSPAEVARLADDALDVCGWQFR